ncbi:rRNA maturation RNase YbeY [Paracrocinitomix mangrovi]|uniref:rRNA maturation RNase YbeY n=1 Tax=Paracrocinitomix mangrovi TaxID=2862509 RepID=UPI001C8EFA4E|nr:rRNA maturation RNase YbeY [Paracrocinitomix mangrovi]UKN00547.1 rRNA maturation RNase YbeY [Paracrocinitomix mangrovi]
MDNIEYNFIDVEIPDFDPEFFNLWISKVVDFYQWHLGDINYVFVTDDYLLYINKEHLDHDYYTDIITFNYNEESSLSGDMFISLDRVKDNAKEFGNGSFHDELCRVVVHGLLHLGGFNDKSNEDEVEMRKQEELCLSLR